jgi:iron(III) transport system ATP-binding protein
MDKAVNRISNGGTPAPAGDAGAHWGRRGTAAATIAATLTFESVERRYGATMALAGVTLDVGAGEIVCLLGPSGCGKTTLLRLAAGLEKPSTGRVLINGLEVSGPARFVPPEERHVGLMFQDFALFPHLTILRNVAFGLKAMPRAEAKQIALQLLGRVGLEHMAGRFPHMLSGGEQQRVALARAIAPRPGVLLMDEPFSGLDVQLRHVMQEETLTLLRETRATSIIVTHDPEEAMRMADRIVVMKRGRIVQAGTAQALYEAPADLFVARLFSEINEIPGRVRAGRLDTPFGSAPAPGLPEGTAAVAAVRQRSISLVPVGSGRAARVLDVKFLGDASVIELAVEGLDGVLRVRTHEPPGLTLRQEVGVSVDPGQVIVFADTEKAYATHGFSEDDHS